MKNISTKDLVMTGSLMALAIVLYLIDKQLTVPLNAIWKTGGASTHLHFLPVIILAAFFDKRLFFTGVTALLFGLFIIGTSAVSVIDYGLEYVVPLLSASSFFFVYPYQKKAKRFRAFLSLGMMLVVTLCMYTTAGVVFYGVDLVGSFIYNGTLIIFPAVILSIVLLPILELCRKLIK